MNEITIFENAKFGKVRTVSIDGAVWFVGKDIAESLGYSNTRDAIASHVDEDDKATVAIHDGSQNRNVVIINESGVYALIFGSQLESAKEFKHWVTSEVLPSIRKTGSYVSQKTEQELNNDEKALRIESARLLSKIAERYSDSKTYQQILDAYATKELTGTFALPLPDSMQEEYTATQIGEMLGISANAVGKIANRLNIKTEQYGRWCIDKSPYARKEVRTFRYFKSAVQKIREELNAA